MGAEGTKTERDSERALQKKQERKKDGGGGKRKLGKGAYQEREREREKKQERKRTNNRTVMNTESSAVRVNTGFQKGCMKLIK